MSKVLIVEDELIIRTALRKLLSRNKYDITEAGSVAEATKQKIDTFDLIISDLRLPGAPGTDLIKLAGDVPVLIMTSYASLRSAVDSMRMGAVDYIAKPFDHDEMLAAVKRVLGKAELRLGARPTKAEAKSSAVEGMIGSSDIMREVYTKIHKVAPTSATVLVLGETGTGKELVASAIHKESPRKDKPIISVNCAAIPETLIEAELFGHEKGAFTGAATNREGLVAAADGGTLFLDEIGELPLEAQARLLRVLQEGEVRPIGATESRKVDVRLVAATHRDLSKLAREGKFREDLYFRINVVQLKLPPLRDRGKDILLLAETFIKRFCTEMMRAPLSLTPEAIQAVTTYPWPGNIRELENAMQRSVILCDSDVEIELSHLAIEHELVRVDETPTMNTSSKEPHEDLSLEDYFQRFVLEHQDHMSETELAKKLGVSRKCLWERRQRLGIPRKKPTQAK
ncbi:MAG: two-component system response regulator HydG [Flavobacteriales bacterium]|jgi:two-component system response regulator HydG